MTRWGAGRKDVNPCCCRPKLLSSWSDASPQPHSRVTRLVQLHPPSLFFLYLQSQYYSSKSCYSYTKVNITLTKYRIPPINYIVTMPTIRSLTSFVNSLLSQTPLLSTFGNTPSCPVDSPLSCHNGTAEPSCCFIQPGGQLLLTQFWDAYPAIGPDDSWTLHGLWYALYRLGISERTQVL